MPRGGARKGAGRPKVNSEERSGVILDELIIPAIKQADLLGDVVLGMDNIRAAYGVQGLRDWQTWFQLVDVGGGVGVGAVDSKWRLKLTMAVAARKLLTTVDANKLPFPPDVIRLAANKKAYGRWSREYAKHATEFATEYGHAVTEAGPFNPDRNYAMKATPVKDTGPRRGQLSPADAGYAELLIGGNNGFSAPYTGFVPDETDIPY